MGRLDCKEPSLIALDGLAEYASYFITASEMEVESQFAGFAAHGLQTSPSGSAGLATLLPYPRLNESRLASTRTAGF
jgi:diaminopropionate ammonia-lyase